MPAWKVFHRSQAWVGTYDSHNEAIEAVEVFIASTPLAEVASGPLVWRSITHPPYDGERWQRYETLAYADDSGLEDMADEQHERLLEIDPGRKVSSMLAFTVLNLADGEADIETLDEARLCEARGHGFASHEQVISNETPEHTNHACRWCGECVQMPRPNHEHVLLDGALASERLVGTLHQMLPPAQLKLPLSAPAGYVMFRHSLRDEVELAYVRPDHFHLLRGVFGTRARPWPRGTEVWRMLPVVEKDHAVA